MNLVNINIKLELSKKPTTDELDDIINHIANNLDSGYEGDLYNKKFGNVSIKHHYVEVGNVRNAKTKFYYDE